MSVIYFADGEEMQQGFDTLAAAMEAARVAPWANGKVYTCPSGHVGYASGGIKSGEWVVATALDRPAHFGTHFWVSG